VETWWKVVVFMELLMRTLCFLVSWLLEVASLGTTPRSRNVKYVNLVDPASSDRPMTADEMRRLARDDDYNTEFKIFG